MKYLFIYLLIKVVCYTSCKEATSQRKGEASAKEPTDSPSFTTAILYTIDSQFYHIADTTWDFPDGKMAYIEAFGGGAFIDSSGRPIHSRYQSYNLSSEEILTFKRNFNKQLCDGIRHACMPIYRDVLVFFDDADNVVGQAHICFGCSDVVVYPNEKFHCQEERTLDYPAFQKFISSIKKKTADNMRLVKAGKKHYLSTVKQ